MGDVTAKAVNSPATTSPPAAQDFNGLPIQLPMLFPVPTDVVVISESLPFLGGSYLKKHGRF
jgi:hypothetical protein